MSISGADPIRASLDAQDRVDPKERQSLAQPLGGDFVPDAIDLDKNIMGLEKQLHDRIYLRARLSRTGDTGRKYEEVAKSFFKTKWNILAFLPALIGLGILLMSWLKSPGSETTKKISDLSIDISKIGDAISVKSLKKGRLDEYRSIIKASKMENASDYDQEIANRTKEIAQNSRVLSIVDDLVIEAKVAELKRLKDSYNKIHATFEGTKLIPGFTQMEKKVVEEQLKIIQEKLNPTEAGKYALGLASTIAMSRQPLY